MSIAVNEKADSRDTGTRTSDWRYTVTGTADHSDAVQALYNEAYGANGTWVIENLQCDPVSIDEGDPDACIWAGSVTFVPPERKKDDPSEVGESSYQFDTGGGSQHITHVKNADHHKATYPSDAFDPKGLIGVTKNGVEGCDIMIPVFNWSETHVVPDSTVTEAYKGKLYSLTACTNAGTFRGNAVGEVLFVGASGTQRGGGDWEITFRFAASPNLTGIQIGDIEGIVKGGWDYLWVRTEQKVHNDELGYHPIAVYVEQVYEPGNFEDLEIAA